MNTLNDSLLGIQLDEYRIVAPLGFGGMARVYRALDTKLQRYVALKVIAPDFRNNDEYQKRFAREAQSIARLEHPHIVHVYRFGEASGLYYMAMRYVEGADLGWLIEDYRNDGELIPIEDGVRFIEDIGQALDYAHAQNVIHRDVKPSNIMIDQGGHAILTDFGLVFLEDVDSQDHVLGSPHYTSPEQAISSGNVVPQSDLYSLGITLFEMLTGELPFSGDEPLDIAMQHLSVLPAPPSYFNKTIPPVIDEIVLRALEKEPHNRYQSGAEMSAALRQGAESWMTDSLRATQLAKRHPSQIRAMQKVSRLIKSSPLPGLSAPTPDNAIPEPVVLSSPPSREKSAPASPSNNIPPTGKAPPDQPRQPSFFDALQDWSARLDRFAQVIIPKLRRFGEQPSFRHYMVLVGAALLGLSLIVLLIAAIRSAGSRIASVSIATTLPTVASGSITLLLATQPPTITQPPSLAPQPTLVVQLSSPPEKRDSVPSGSHRLGEFAVEWYCNDQGFGVRLVNNRSDWACTNPNGSIRFVLGPADFDNICRNRYANPVAFAIQDQQKPVRAYNWSCYEYVAAPSPTAVPMATPSVQTLQPRVGEGWIALVNISSFPLSIAQVEFQREAVTLQALTAWGHPALMPGECLRLYRGEAAPTAAPANCAQPIDYAASPEERARWFEGKVKIVIDPSTSYCYPSEKC